ncbi:Polyprotein [Phytophthora palmivora]|uniref:Polyprotein n=1 Tax=Phytophthora palmivora TaxID=4796 RepID=A0A2P4Y0N9_9STRA|nr:Polyprotein [Phytophthora palmivora]
MIGQVVIYAKDQNSIGMVKLELSNVEYSPHGSVNLISLGVMEDNSWGVKNTPKGHYWLKPAEMNDLSVPMAMMTVNADANELMRWHERLGHHHVAAIKHIADNGTVAGMNIPAALFKQPF